MTLTYVKRLGAIGSFKFVLRHRCERPARVTSNFKRVVVLLLFGLLLGWGHVNRAAAAPLRLGVLGDSMSAGDGSDFGSYPNWVTQLTKSGAFSVSPIGNQAVGGAVSTDMVNEQLPAIQAQIQAGQLDYTLVMIGANDAAYAAADFLTNGNLTGTVQSLVNTVVQNVTFTLNTIAHTGSVHQIVANIPDQSVAPLVKSLFTQYHATPAQIAEFKAGIQLANSEIAAFALRHNIPLIDMFAATDSIIAHPPLRLAGVNFTNLFAADGYHPGAVADGLVANAVINAANRQFHAGITPISDQQIVRNVGRVPFILGPTYYNMTPYVLLAVPEPSSWVLAGMGALGVVIAGSRRKWLASQ